MAAKYTSLTYILLWRTFRMLTIAESDIFSAAWPAYWTPEEFGDFCAWLAWNPNAGDVIPRSNGCRKVRWVVEGRGKRDGVRVIYFNRLADGTIWLLTMYAKNVREDIDVKVLSKIREMVDGKAQRKGTREVRS
jgi:hypothetical protein